MPGTEQLADQFDMPGAEQFVAHDTEQLVALGTEWLAVLDMERLVLPEAPLIVPDIEQPATAEAVGRPWTRR